MLKLAGFGLTLEPLRAETAETVRVWRNQDAVLAFMEYQELISPEMQQEWLRNIDPATSVYFLISVEDVAVGMIHLAAIDHISKSAEAGLFIGNRGFKGTGVTLGASLLLLDYAFETLQLEHVFAKVNNSNIEAEKYNQFIGFKREKVLNSRFNLWKISKNDFNQKRDSLARLIG